MTLEQCQDPTRSYQAALDRNELTGRLDLRLVEIGTILHVHETVLLAVPGPAGDETEALVVTTQRLLRVRYRPFANHLLAEHPASYVVGASYRPGVFTAIKVELRHGLSQLRFTPGNKQDAQRFTTEFNHLIRTGRLPDHP